MKSLTYLRLVLALVCKTSKPSDSDKKIQQTQDKVLQAEISHVISSISSLPRIQLIQKLIPSLELNFLIRIQAITLAMVLILSNSGCTSLVPSDSGKEVVSNMVTKNLNEGKVSRTPILKLGSKGEQVVELKNRLVTLDYLAYYDKNGDIFDVKTEEAVKKFQKDNSLKVDGIVETKTNEALFEAIWPSSLSGRALFNRGLKQPQFSDALRDYNEAIKREKNLAEAYYRRGLLHAYAGAGNLVADIDRDINKALNDFTEAIKINPDYVEAYLERGIIHNGNKDWKSAIDDWTQAILIEPDNTEAYYRRAKAKEQLKNTKDIINDYIEVIKIKLKSEQDADLKKQVEQAINNFQNNQVSPELMLALSRGAVSASVSEIFLREYPSYLSEEIESLYQSAIEGLEKAINNFRNTQDKNILFLLYYYKNLNQYELKKDDLKENDLKKREIVQLLLDNFDTKKTSQSTFVSTHYYRGLLFLERGEQEEAKKEFDKAIERQPNFTKAYYLRGIIRSKQGAISDFKKYLQGDPEMEEAKKNSTLKEREGCFSQEIPKEYLETLKSSVPLEASAYLRRGKLRFLLGDYPGAKRDFQEVIKADPNLAADAYYQKGKVAAYEFYYLIDRRNFKQAFQQAKEAKENFDEAIKKDPNFSEAYLDRGYLQYKIIAIFTNSTEKDEAKKTRDTVFNKKTDVAWIDDSQNDFKQAIKIDKTFAQAYYLMVVTEKYKSRIQVEQQTEDIKKYKFSPTEINNLTEVIRSDIYFYSDFIGKNRLTMKRAICVDLGNSEQDNTTKPVSIIPFEFEKEYSYYSIALDNYRKKEYKQVIENISEAIKLNPNISDYYVIRGAAYYFSNSKYYKEALKDFKASIQLEPRLTSLFVESDTTYSSSISHFLMGRIIENQDISQKEYQVALTYLPQADWIIPPGGDGTQTQNTRSSSSAKVPSKKCR